MKAASRFLRMSLTWGALMAVLYLLPAAWDKAGKGGEWVARVIAFLLEAVLNVLLNFTFPVVDAFSPRFPKNFGLSCGWISLALSAGFVYLPFQIAARSWFESILIFLLLVLVFSFLFQIFRKRRPNAVWSLSALSAHAFLSISLMGWAFAPGLWMENAGWEAGALMIVGLLWEFLLFSLSFALILKSAREDGEEGRPKARTLAFAPALAIPMALGGLLPAFFCALGI
ncbi:MAG: hypothetical protein IKT06_03290 [Aeriscardovia sp.]|nr:hypothetical protein [Aeriscardovia sp.]